MIYDIYLATDMYDTRSKETIYHKDFNCLRTHMLHGHIYISTVVLHLDPEEHVMCETLWKC